MGKCFRLAQQSWRRYFLSRLCMHVMCRNWSRGSRGPTNLGGTAAGRTDRGKRVRRYSHLLGLTSCCISIYNAST